MLLFSPRNMHLILLPFKLNDIKFLHLHVLLLLLLLHVHLLLLCLLVFLFIHHLMMLIRGSSVHVCDIWGYSTLLHARCHLLDW